MAGVVFENRLAELAGWYGNCMYPLVVPICKKCGVDKGGTFDVGILESKKARDAYRPITFVKVTLKW